MYSRSSLYLIRKFSVAWDLFLESTTDEHELIIDFLNTTGGTGAGREEVHEGKRYMKGKGAGREEVQEGKRCMKGRGA